MISIMGLYKYNPAVFDNFKLPEGVEKDVVVDLILSSFAELEILYPNWDIMRHLIGVWSAMEFENWKRLYKTVTAEYDPISNYDRREEWSDEAEAKGKVAAFNEEKLVDSSSGSSKTKHSGRVSGNIGVTTSQQMIREEIDVRKWTIYGHIADSFKKRFCLLVY